ncbi:RadC family protein [Xylanibacter ruminicola]|uniref:DNA repair protein RadC n=1 Tax=Xylanibacter ruminicola TaxID=839 RepID=A0A1M6Y5H3_XYLRU|nr:DNA repair protein RadC [Xylanibacter ruminicola]SHL13442.1 DNA repair protein RadC [Xylanibacter ruminicola]
MSDKLNINQWAEEDRPREKMANLGTEALSSAELLAILIGSGSTKESAVDLMKRILNDCNNSLNTLGKKSINDLCQYNGVGPAKAITILAACELGKRRQMESPEERPDLGTATNIYNHMHPVMQDLDVEEFWALMLNQNYRLIKKVRIAHGGITETTVDIRIIMREAVQCNATQLAVCHNHPSGNSTPSEQDDILTRSIMQACNVMNIHFLDHVIVTDGVYYSYHEKGRC